MILDPRLIRYLWCILRFHETRISLFICQQKKNLFKMIMCLISAEYSSCREGWSVYFGRAGRSIIGGFRAVLFWIRRIWCISRLSCDTPVSVCSTGWVAPTEWVDIYSVSIDPRRSIRKLCQAELPPDIHPERRNIIYAFRQYAKLSVLSLQE